MSVATTASEERLRAFRVGEWAVEPSLNLIRRGTEEVRLRPKVMDVLVLLAANAGRVVSREELIDTVWAKEFVADSVLASAISELRAGFGDDTANPTVVETIPKRGYRLIAPLGDVAAAPPGAPERRPGPARRLPWGRAVGVLLGVLALGGAGLAIRATLSVPAAGRATGESIRVAVLPFETVGGPEHEYFAAGLTEEVSSRLTAIDGLVVVARSSAARFEDATQPLREIGRQLEAGFLVTGSVRWQADAGGGLVARISPRLVRAADETVVWADTYDRRADDVLGVQAEIARQVAIALDLALSSGTRLSVENVPTRTPEAYEAYLRGLYYVGHFESEESQRLAASMFARAVELDPGFVLAWAQLSRVDGLLVHYGFDRSAARREAARTAAARVEQLAPGSFEAIVARARALGYADMDYAGAAAAYETAARLRPADPDLLGNQADARRRAGRFDLARTFLAQAVRLDPTSPGLLNELGVTETVLGMFAEADAHFARSVELAPDQHTAYEWRAYNTLLWNGDLPLATRQLDAIPVPTRPSVVLARWRFALMAGDTAAALDLVADLPGEAAMLQSHFTPRSLLLAETYRVMGYAESAREMFADAARLLEREVTARPEDARIYSALAMAYAGLGRRQDALQVADAARVLWPPGADAIRNACRIEQLARAYLLLGDEEGALASLAELGRGPVPPYAAPFVDLDPRYAAVRGRAQLSAAGRPLVSGAHLL